MTIEELRELEETLQEHRNTKAINANYPSLPRSVREGREIFVMNEQQLSHLRSCLLGFDSRLHNYNEATKRRLENIV